MLALRSFSHKLDKGFMTEQKEEGIVLKATDYKESSRIVSLFTKHSGMISLIVKRLSPRKPTLINLTTPLCRAEFIYRKGRSSLFTFIDGSILDLHLPLRKSYLYLKTAGNCLKMIHTTQLPEKPAPKLYHLLSLSLKNMPLFSDPSALHCLFKLKLLKHEGLLSIDTLCSRCQKEPPKCLTQGEGLCARCAKTGGVFLNQEEWQTLFKLLFARSFKELTCLKPSSHLQKSIEICFQAV